MKSKILKTFFWAAVIFCSIFTRPILAAEGAVDLLKDSFGPRAAGLGGAFSAVSETISAPFWNPAGLGDFDKMVVASSYANLLSDISRFGLVFTFPILDGCSEYSFLMERSSGAPLTTVGADDRPDLNGTFADTKMVLSASYAREIFLKGLLLGANLKYQTESLASASANGIGFDLGGIYYPFVSPIDKGPWSLGLTLRNPMNTAFKWSTGKTDNMPREIILGTAYSGKLGSQKFLLTADFNYSSSAKKFCFGAEYWLIDFLPLRLGYNKEKSLTFGTGLKFGQIGFDLSYASHPDLGATYQFGIEWVLGK